LSGSNSKRQEGSIALKKKEKIPRKNTQGFEKKTKCLKGEKKKNETILLTNFNILRLTNVKTGSGRNIATTDLGTRKLKGDD